MTRAPGTGPAFRFPWRSRRRIADEVDDELAFHLARRAEALEAAGLAPDEARREAARRFGDLTHTRRYCRDEDERREREARQMMSVHELKQDVGYALRSLRSAPGFALVALLTLAFGIGANTAIFSVVRGVLLAPLPFPAADRVVRVWHVNPSTNETRSKVSEPDFLDWQRASARAERMAGYFYQPEGSGADLTGSGTPEHVQGAYFTPGFFETLGARAALGRTIRPEESVRGNDRYVVLGYGLWQRRFGGDPSVLGRALTVDGVPHTVLGVMPAAFAFPVDGVEFWIPVSTLDEDAIGRDRGTRFLDVVARLKPGATAAQLHDELAAETRRTAEREAQATGWTDVAVLPVREAMLGDVRRPLLVLAGAVAFVLLITCVNIAGLLLARATARQRELAVRSALGAGRGRIIRQLLTESLVLALAGGALGVLLAWLGVRAITASGAAELPRAQAIRVDASVLLFALGVSTAAGVVFGLLPALRASSGRLEAALRAGGRGTAGGVGQRMRSALVVAEVALAAVLVVGAGLAARSFARLMEVDPGFRAEHVLAVQLGMSPPGGVDREGPYYAELLARVAAVPGVQLVGAAKNLPLRGMGEMRYPVIIPGESGGAGDRTIRIPMLHVSTDYFRAMGIPLRAGRAFTAADRDSAPTTWIVNEAFVRRYFPGQSVVGREVRLGQHPIRLVGVVGDVRQRSLTEPPEPMAFIHYPQNMRGAVSLAVRTAGDPLRHADAVRRAIWSLNPNQTITRVETMQSIVGDTVARPRLLASLLALFGGMGLSLGALGLYGVLAFTVSRRRQEIGLRVALGASPRSVLGLVVGQGMALALAGVALGVAGAAALTRLMAAVLFEVPATDPTTFATVVVVLLITALLASWLPARRALRIDPVAALRES